MHVAGPHLRCVLGSTLPGACTTMDRQMRTALPGSIAHQLRNESESSHMMMDYHLRDTAGVFSPALLFYKEQIQRNITQALAMAGHPQRLRPHVKTHKTREIVRM